MVSRKWLIAGVAACMLASACSDFNTNLSIQTSTSSLTFVSPQTATIGSIPSGGLPIVATGTGFVSSGSFILWNAGLSNQMQLANTTFVSSTELTATVPASVFVNTGTTPITVPVAVQIPGSAVSGTTNVNNGNASTTTEVSNIVLFTINPTPAPGPTISSVSASTTSMASTPYCSASGLTLTVTGTNFVNGAVVNWNGSPRTTTFVSSTQLTAVILPTDTATPGPIGVSVSQSSGTSSSIQFTMTTPAASLAPPSIISISQSLNPPVGTATSVPAGSPTFTLTVNGSSLLPCSTVQFGADAQTTTYVSPTQLTATIPASEVFSPRSVNVTVSTIGPGGGSSNPVVFTITP